jgi:hypothetical protein
LGLRVERKPPTFKLILPHKNLKKHKIPHVGGLISSTRYLVLCSYGSNILCGRAKVSIKIIKTMCKSEIFAETINLVSRETEIPVNQILSSKKDTETVDARYLLVSLLSDRGMYPSQIASHINKTKRAVNYMITNFRMRMESGKMLRIYWENIRKSLGSN